MFLIDKYKPENVYDSFFNNDIINELLVMASHDNMPHIIFFGPQNSGKQVIIDLLLKFIYGENCKTKKANYEITSSSNKKTIETITQSEYHIEITPKGTNYDKYLIQEIVNKYAKNETTTLQSFQKNKTNAYKIIVINNVDNLSTLAQMALRRTIEVHSNNCRFILKTNSLSKIIKELQSRCVKFRVPIPNKDEMTTYLMNIIIYEKINLKLENVATIVNHCKGDIKECLWIIEKYRVDKICVEKIYNNDYRTSIKAIVNMVLTNKDDIKDVRKIIHDLFITNYPKTVILTDIIELLVANDKINISKATEILNLGTDIEFRLNKGRRDIIHFDYFIQSLFHLIHSK